MTVICTVDKGDALKTVNRCFHFVFDHEENRKNRLTHSNNNGFKI